MQVADGHDVKRPADDDPERLLRQFRRRGAPQVRPQPLDVEPPHLEIGISVGQACWLLLLDMY